MNKGKIGANVKPYIPKKLTQSKLIKLLYETSSQASSQISYNQGLEGESNNQPMGSIQLPGNEDLVMGVDNQLAYMNMNN